MHSGLSGGLGALLPKLWGLGMRARLFVSLLTVYPPAWPSGCQAHTRTDDAVRSAPHGSFGEFGGRRF